MFTVRSAATICESYARSWPAIFRLLCREEPEGRSPRSETRLRRWGRPCPMFSLLPLLLAAPKSVRSSPSLLVATWVRLSGLVQYGQIAPHEYEQIVGRVPGKTRFRPDQTTRVS